MSKSRVGWLVLSILFAGAGGAASAQSEADAAALRPERPRLERDMDDLRLGTWLHTGGIVGGILFFPTAPVLLPVGTTLGALTALEAADSYRDTVGDVLGTDPLPSLDAERGWLAAGTIAYVVGEIALLYMIISAFDSGTAVQDPRIYDLRLYVSGSLFIGSMALGIGATGHSTWRARNTTVRYHNALW